MMAENRPHHSVLMNIRDSVPLNVSASRLTADSSVFSHLIHELGQSEIEMDDFEPETVILFVTALEDQSSLENIEDSMFRELHKLAVVFQVGWLVSKCRKWLYKKIQQLSPPLEYTLQFFVFEECLFIVKKWDVKRPMNLLLSKLVCVDNADFISRYIEDMGFSETNSIQLKFLLKFAGTNNKIFIDIMSRDLQNRQSLTGNLRYLLKSINFDQRLNKPTRNRPYGEIFEKIAMLPGILKDDLRFALQMSAGASNNAESHPNQDNIVSYLENYPALFPENLSEVIPFVREHSPIQIDVMMAVDLLLMIVCPDGEEVPFLTTEAEQFVRQLEDLVQEGSSKLVSAQYIDTVLSALRLSQKQNKEYVVEILEMIREKENLASYSSFVRVPVSNITQNLPIDITWFKDKKVTFQASFSSLRNVIPECNREGECGFLISKNVSNEPADYVKCFVTCTALYTYSILCSPPTINTVLRYAEGFIPGKTLFSRVFALPMLAGAAHVALVKYKDVRNSDCVTTWNLDTEDNEHYRYSSAHYHEYFSAEDIQLHAVNFASLKDGTRISLPTPIMYDNQIFMDRVWRKWLPEFKIEGKRELCMDYCIKKFLVAK